MEQAERTKNKIAEAVEMIVGKENILSDYESVYAYSTDSTNIAKTEKLADIVVFPVNKYQVSAIMKFANENKIPVTARAAGTSVCGACLPKCGGIILSLAKMDKIIEINKDNLICISEPGVVIEDLKKLQKELSAIQIAVDKTNLTTPIEY